MPTPTTRPARDYSRLSSLLRAGPSRDATMAAAVDILWDVLAPTSISWLGFYTKPPDREEMILGPRRDKPACSPIGLHGMCGRSLLARRPIILKDARALAGSVNPDREGGAHANTASTGYIACDPLDRAELVIPLFEENSSCWGVLDLDSHDPDVFDDRDAAELTRLMEQIGLSTPPAQPAPPLHL
jgi:putative methionine-R-sulfoxide reductase with GAF domain